MYGWMGCLTRHFFRQNVYHVSMEVFQNKSLIQFENSCQTFDIPSKMLSLILFHIRFPKKENILMLCS